MKQAIITMSLAALLFVIAATNAVASDVVILACRLDGTVSPVRPIEVDGCSKSAGVTRACPTVTGASCANQLASFLSLGGFTIVDIHPYEMDGLVYTLVR